MDDSQYSENTKKWIGCANHTLQLALLILDKDTNFSKTVDDVVAIMRKIKIKPLASREFRTKTRRSIILPAPTR